MNKGTKYKVTYSSVSIFNEGDIITPIKQTAIGVLIGKDYRKSLYFESNGRNLVAINDEGKTLASIEKIK